MLGNLRLINASQTKPLTIQDKPPTIHNKPPTIHNKPPTIHNKPQAFKANPHLNSPFWQLFKINQAEEMVQSLDQHPDKAL
jgi:hypothetical protein